MLVRRCECGAEIVREYAGRRIDEPAQPVQTWSQCARGHALLMRLIPENLGSRA